MLGIFHTDDSEFKRTIDKNVQYRLILDVSTCEEDFVNVLDQNGKPTGLFFDKIAGVFCTEKLIITRHCSRVEGNIDQETNYMEPQFWKWGVIWAKTFAKEGQFYAGSHNRMTDHFHPVPTQKCEKQIEYENSATLGDVQDDGKVFFCACCGQSNQKGMTICINDACRAVHHYYNVHENRIQNGIDSNPKQHSLTLESIRNQMVEFTSTN